MRFETLIDDYRPWRVEGPADNSVADVTDDSRRVTPGCCFVARQDAAGRWRDYVQAAVDGGATSVVVPDEMQAPAGVALAVFRKVDQGVAGKLAARFFNHPAKQLKLVGVTGTNGKTTVATLTQYLLNAAGEKCGLLGTVATDTGHPDGPRPAELTTPGAIELQRLFAEMVANGCTACAMEVSSHALHQGRVDGLKFEAAVFTNLTQDHLDYHGTMEAYAAAKAKLFRLLSRGGWAILPREDLVASPRMLEELASLSVVVWTSSDNLMTGGRGGRDYLADAQRMSSKGSLVNVWTPMREPVQASVSLIGEHNLRNLIQAIAAADAVAPLDHDRLVDALADCPAVPGRLEPVAHDGATTPAVLVDYAHTPDALENVLNALRPLTKGRLICVFGCGGDRDRRKRPLMAHAACDLADLAWLTSDNPRSEDPQRILDDALAGLSKPDREKVRVEIDRAAAIRAAIDEATPNDTVLIAGKGHEDYQIIADAEAPGGTRKIHFDDREQAAAALTVWVEKINE